MLHGQAAEMKEDRATPYKQRLGVKMFGVYGLIYVSFVAINVIQPSLMEVPVLFGVNLACIYGFGLIVIALVLALIYNAYCTGFEAKYNAPDNAQEALETSQDQEPRQNAREGADA